MSKLRSPKEKRLYRKYYGRENMMKGKQKIKAPYRFKVEHSKVLDRGLLCCN